jgi:glutamate-1-semialdehyde 2,1-aminomutase
MTFPDPASRSAALNSRARRVMPGGNTRHMITFEPYTIYAERGQGCRVTDVDGNTYLDWINTFSALIHGYGHPEVNAAILRQAERMTACILPAESEIELAELLVERLPAVDQVRFANSGTEAVMVAIKAARGHTGRPVIAKCEGGYHGQYDFVEPSFLPTPENWGPRERPAATPFAKGTPRGVLDNVLIIPFNEPEIALALLEEHAAQLAGVIVDPYPARLGFTAGERAFLQSLRDFCDRNGSLLIFDEVFCNRASYHGAHGRAGVHPDLVTLGKIIGGGFPIGAIGGRQEVMSVFDNLAGPPAVSHSGTFTGNPMAMAAGVAAMRLLTPEAFETLERQGDRLRTGLTRQMRAAGLRMRANGFTSMTSLQFFEEPIRTYREFHTRSGPGYLKRMQALHRCMLNEGVLMATRGLMIGSTPMTDADIDETIDRCGRAFARFAAEAPATAA